MPLNNYKNSASLNPRVSFRFNFAFFLFFETKSSLELTREWTQIRGCIKKLPTLRSAKGGKISKLCDDKNTRAQPRIYFSAVKDE